MAKNKFEEIKENGIEIPKIRYDFRKNGIVFLITTVIFVFLTGVFLNLCLLGTIGKISLLTILKLSFFNVSAYGIGIALSIVVQIALISVNIFFEKEEPYDIEAIVKKGIEKKENIFNPIGGIESLILNNEEVEEEIEIEEIQDEISMEDFIKQKMLQENITEEEPPTTGPDEHTPPPPPPPLESEEEAYQKYEEENNDTIEEDTDGKENTTSEKPKRVVVVEEDSEDTQKPLQTAKVKEHTKAKQESPKGHPKERKQEILDTKELFLKMKS